MRHFNLFSEEKVKTFNYHGLLQCPGRCPLFLVGAGEWGMVVVWGSGIKITRYGRACSLFLQWMLRIC